MNLNEAQKAAVMAADGPTLVLAGAGSGKTRVIVERIVHLIQERGVDPRNILAMTFTNRAAQEMKARVTARLGIDRLATWIGTFHSFGLFMLRREADKLALTKTFTVFDEGDQLAVMRRLIRELPAAYQKVTPRDALQWISLLKQDVKEPDPAKPPKMDGAETLMYLWNKYHAALAKAGAVDFDDLLVLQVRLLEQHPDVRDKYRQRYRHVLIDEYQDTNGAQYRIARGLSDGHSNIFVVGDEDQSIYSWRGADFRNILNFERDFPAATVIRLEQNYRSTAPILAAANAVVAHNEQRLGKNLWTDQQGGEPVRYFLAEDEKAEVKYVVDDILNASIAKGQTAILYRTNGQSRVIEEELRKRAVPHVIVGSVRFYSRKEIKDLLAYLRLMVNPSDDESVRRVLNVPARGIGEVTMARLEQYGAERGMSLLQVLQEVDQDQTIAARTRDAISGFVHLIDDLALEAKKSTVCELVQTLLEKTGYRDYIRECDEKDLRDRLENIEEFLASCLEFDTGQRGGLLEFLQELSLLGGVDEWETSGDAVTLMTCHSAKGLEFDSVYLVGLEEGLLPHASSQSDTEVEEERRLCYVAMTRARKKLTLTAAERRSLYGMTEPRDVSRFIGEIPSDHIEEVRKKKPAGPPAMAPRPVGAGAGRAVSLAAAHEAEPTVKMGTPVRHAKFGRGYVQSTSGSGDNLKARIRFDTGHSATFLLAKAPIEILKGKRP